MKQDLSANYWNDRYLQDSSPWDIGAVSTPLKTYFDQLTNKDLAILIPGAGNAWEAEYLHSQGFANVTVCDLAEAPLKNLAARCPGIPAKNLIQGNFFDLKENSYDLIVEQTFFCALDPSLRPAYAKKVFELLHPGGHLMGLLFNAVFEHQGPPFGGTAEEYRGYFEGRFEFRTFENAYNSIKPRAGRELFVNLVKTT